MHQDAGAVPPACPTRGGRNREGKYGDESFGDLTGHSVSLPEGAVIDGQHALHRVDLMTVALTTTPVRVSISFVLCGYQRRLHTNPELSYLLLRGGCSVH